MSKGPVLSHNLIARILNPLLRTENGSVDMDESIQDSGRQTRLRQKPHRYRSNEETLTSSHQPLLDTGNNNPWVEPDFEAIARARLEAATPLC